MCLMSCPSLGLDSDPECGRHSQLWHFSGPSLHGYRTIGEGALCPVPPLHHVHGPQLLWPCRAHGHNLEARPGAAGESDSEVQRVAQRRQRPQQNVSYGPSP
jgi:hypothetical protein